MDNKDFALERLQQAFDYVNEGLIRPTQLITNPAYSNFAFGEFYDDLDIKNLLKNATTQNIEDTNNVLKEIQDILLGRSYEHSNIKFESAEDFRKFENMFNFQNEISTSVWKNSEGTPIKTKEDIFNEIGNRLRRNGKTEHYVANKLKEIQSKAKEFNFTGFDFENLIEKRKIKNIEEKRSKHIRNKNEREEWIKYQRIEQLEKELERFPKDSLEYNALKQERDNLLADFTVEDSPWNREVLQLNPPREGAPMFEGMAVPSDQVYGNDNATLSLETTNKLSDEDYKLVDDFNKQWYENKQKEFAERELEIQKEFSDVNTLKPEDVMGNTVEETIENATENVLEETVEAAGETIAKEVIEEGTEKILKEVTGINVELDGLNKKRTPKKLKKGTGKYKNKTGKQVYEKSRYWGFDYNNGDDIYVHGTKKGVSKFDKKDLYKNDTNTRTNNTNNYADDIKKKLKEIDSWSDDYIRGLSEEDIINYSDNGEVFEKLYDRWNELNSSANTNTNTNTSGDNKQTKQNKQKTKNVFDDYAEWKEASDVLDYTNPEKYYYTGNYRFDTNPETGIPDIDQYKKHTRNLEEIGYDVPIIESIDADGRPIKGDIRQVRPDVDLPKGAPRKTGISKYLDNFKNMSFLEKAMTLGNVAGAVSDYKNARREGHGVVSSAVRAGTEFAIGEALGMYYPLYLLAKEAPGLVIQGTEMLYKENRKMNSAANQQVFGGAQFQDTQQLATMRQSGMEMAKMAQYNLQQTLMGQEATYLHR